ncbi:MAG: N-6 DNA methylase [Acidobacteria bacterium]|jgi:predicted helicase|nr:N-6 DNA methylase [Acidobacteriota bacterium]
MITKKLHDYLSEIFGIFSRGDAREESYYEHLNRLILEVAGLLSQSKISVTTMPCKTEGGNPDFRVWDGKSKITGYIEAKKPETDLDDVEKSEQIKRYITVFPNFILTNFLEFRFYREGLFIGRAAIARQHTMVELRAKPVLENQDLFRELLEKFFSFTFPRGLNARRLAAELAKRTRFLRDQVVIEELKETSPDKHEKSNTILGYFKAFKQYLILDLTEEDFADIYSQTITYGLFAARTRCSGEFHRQNAVHYIPQTIGILHDVFAYISLRQPPEQLVWIIDDIAEVLASVDVEMILKEFYSEGKGEDPIVHFYETFLSEYDPGLREKRGVYYTPEPVVSFIVRSVNRILKEKFQKTDGLADIHINIFDPAAGTLTFITEAAKLALEEFTGKYGEGIKEQFIRGHLLQNFYAFELMMAPYAVGHLKMSYVLDEMGFRLPEGERFNLYLTNTLEMEDIEQTDLPGISTLSEESRLAGKVKKQTPILVILGNPPYSGHSSNTGEWISTEIKEYYRVDGKPLKEKNPKWLQDDYVKFIRFAQWKLDQNGEGVLGFITNHSYLDNPTFRGMRKSLMKSFDEIYLLDLHGNSLKKERCPDSTKDENVFDIRQGVAIVLMIKKGGKQRRENDCIIHHADLWGLREYKYGQLNENDISTIPWQTLSPTSEFYLFTPRTPHSNQLDSLYQKYPKITDIFPVYSVGIVTARDELTIHDSPDKAYRTVSQFSKLAPEEARVIYNLGPDARDWKVQLAQQDLISSGLARENIVPILYRPFDIRYTYYTLKSRGFLCMPRPEVMRHMLEKDNIAIITSRLTKGEKFKHVQISNNIVEVICMSPNTSNNGFVFPLYTYPGKNKKDLFNNKTDQQNRQPNIPDKIFQDLQNGFSKKSMQEITITAEDIFYYIYAVLYSNIYREKYAELLKIDFPRVPFTNDYVLFSELGQLGKVLAEIHLMKSPELDNTFSRFEKPGSNLVEKIIYSDNKVYINKEQYFSNIAPEIWETRIGGYQVMDKWLKDRKGQALMLDDIKHYIRIASVLELTGRYQQKIDSLYPQVEEKLSTYM